MLYSSKFNHTFAKKHSLWSFPIFVVFQIELLLLQVLPENIGVALCRRLAAYGVSIAAADISIQTLADRLSDIPYATIRFYQIDVRDRNSVT